MTDNELIAEFMGSRISKEDGRYCVYSWKGGRCIQHMPVGFYGTEDETIKEIKKHLLADYGDWGNFHTSWDCLMPAVEKWNNLSKKNKANYLIISI